MRASLTRRARAFAGAGAGATIVSLVAVVPAAATADGNGLRWPQQQLLPHFAPVEALDVVNMLQRPGDERLLYEAMRVGAASPLSAPARGIPELVHVAWD